MTLLTDPRFQRLIDDFTQDIIAVVRDHLLDRIQHSTALAVLPNSPPKPRKPRTLRVTGPGLPKIYLRKHPPKGLLQTPVEPNPPPPLEESSSSDTSSSSA